MNEYLPSNVIPTGIQYDYGALSFCQSLSKVIQFKIEQNITDISFNQDIELVDKNITNLLSTVNPQLVKKYFPDFYIE